MNLGLFQPHFVTVPAGVEGEVLLDPIACLSSVAEADGMGVACQLQEGEWPAHDRRASCCLRTASYLGSERAGVQTRTARVSWVNGVKT